MQAVDVDLRVIAHDFAQRANLPVVHIRARQRGIAQRRHLEFAEVALYEIDMLRRDGGRARRIVVVWPEQVELAALQLPDAFVAARIDAAFAGEERHTRRVKLAVGETRPRMAGRAVAFADENFEPALRGYRIARGGGAVAARE